MNHIPLTVNPFNSYLLPHGRSSSGQRRTLTTQLAIHTTACKIAAFYTIYDLKLPASPIGAMVSTQHSSNLLPKLLFFTESVYFRYSTKIALKEIKKKTFILIKNDAHNHKSV